MTYKELKAKNIKETVFGEDEDGNAVVVSSGKTEDNEPYYRVDTVQENDWLRTNIYYEDGTIEELYDK